MIIRYKIVIEFDTDELLVTDYIKQDLEYSLDRLHRDKHMCGNYTINVAPSQSLESPAIPQQPQSEICCTGCKNLMPNGERDCGMNFPPCYKNKLSPVR